MWRTCRGAFGARATSSASSGVTAGEARQEIGEHVGARDQIEGYRPAGDGGDGAELTLDRLDRLGQLVAIVRAVAVDVLSAVLGADAPEASMRAAPAGRLGRPAVVSV